MSVLPVETASFSWGKAQERIRKKRTNLPLYVTATLFRYQRPTKRQLREKMG